MRITEEEEEKCKRRRGRGTEENEARKGKEEKGIELAGQDMVKQKGWEEAKKKKINVIKSVKRG